ncbi:MAG: hypothetical protein WDO12_04290 [Pseudomonadota bacterium]
MARYVPGRASREGIAHVEGPFFRGKTALCRCGGHTPQQVGADRQAATLRSAQARGEVACDLRGLAETAFAMARAMQWQWHDAIRRRMAGCAPRPREQRAQHPREGQVAMEFSAA